MDSLYTEELEKYLHAQDWPKGFAWRIIEIDDRETNRRYLQFQVFRDNLNALDGVDKLRVAKMLNDCLSRISKSGVPIYTEVARGNGQNVSGA